ncbi:IclR family transcriptional regulator [Pseudalkalibacillus sp. R45]|uniref:IclR family transcriptional regulator n=1 Tax=Pseudalkalibacillus sp. R45 TaxID=3457433 RepID=UPI003FCE1270
MTEQSKGTVQSVERAIDLLYCFTLNEYELSLADFVNKTGLNRTTVFRLLNSLKDKGMISRNQHNGLYRLGLPLIGMGQIVSETIDVRQEALPVLKQLSKETGETVSLNIIQANRRVCVEKSDGSEDIRQFVRLGYPYPLVRGASGKALFAFCEEEFIEEEISTWERENQKVIDRDTYYKELETIRKNRLAISKNDRVFGAYSISAPIFNNTYTLVAGISLSGMSIKLTEELELKYGELIRNAALTISKKMGYSLTGNTGEGGD